MGDYAARLELVSEVLKQPYTKVAPNNPLLFHERMVGNVMRDLREAFDKDCEQYYLGTIVFERHPGGRLTLRDGRQRLMAMTILLDCLRGRLAGTKRKRVQGQARDVMRWIDEFLDGMLEAMPRSGRAILLRRAMSAISGLMHGSKCICAIRSLRRRARAAPGEEGQGECFCRLLVDQEFKFGRLINRNVSLRLTRLSHARWLGWEPQRGHRTKRAGRDA